MSKPPEAEQTPRLDIDRIASARVMVVGCGALGNEVLKNLVLSGVRRLVVVDNDLVEERNLCHSVLFRPSDIGLPKAHVAATALQALAPDLDCRTIVGNVEHDVGLGLFADCSVVVGCVDNRWARYCINRLCLRAATPWVDGAIAHLEGTARVFAPGINCYACSLGEEGEKEMQQHISCADVAQAAVRQAHAPTTVIAASLIGAVQAQEALKIVSNGIASNSLIGHMFCYDGDVPQARLVRFQAWDDDCPVHELWSPVERMKIGIDHTVAETLTAISEEILGGEASEIALTDFSFVDFAENRLSGEPVELMCPSFDVEKNLQNIFGNVDVNEYLCHNYSLLNAEFPYPDLSLRHIGFADEAVLRVNETRFIRLSACI